MFGFFRSLLGNYGVGSVCAFCLVAHFLLLPVRASSVDESDFLKHEVQFAILLQIINFIEWPMEGQENHESVRIGIYAENDVRTSLRGLIKDSDLYTKIEIVDVFPAQDEEVFKSLDILYFGNEMDDFSDDLLVKLKDDPIVIVGSQDGFLTEGGMLNFVDNDNRIAFEINVERGEKTGISFRAKLLRLAQRVVY